MKKILYLDCSTGISGDMFVAAMLDLCGDVERLNQVLKTLNLDGFEIKVSKVVKSAIDCLDFDVVLEHDNHDHDMDYLFGHELHHHEDDHDHRHHHGDSHHHHHEHRGLLEITDIIQNSQMSNHAKEIALKIFGIIADAEAKAHGMSREEVHFHEVGAVDSIVDIVSAAVLIDEAGYDEVIVTDLTEGTGSVRSMHGILFIPVPAVANIVSAHDIALRITDTHGELVTPTGAAIVAAIRTSDTLPESFVIKKIGLGAGKREYERPSILRAMEIVSNEETDHDTICKLETNVDDITGEQLGYVMEVLFEAGARDVHYIPVYMKKNRPAYELVVICDKESKDTLMNLIFKHTSTVGIRYTYMKRHILKREETIINTEYGDIRVKNTTLPDESIRSKIEYEDLKRISKENNKSIEEIKEEIKNYL